MSRKSSIFIYVLHRPGSERVAPVHTGVNSISRVAAELTAQNGPDQTAATLDRASFSTFCGESLPTPDYARPSPIT
jgi:hypothetical protein